MTFLLTYIMVNNNTPEKKYINGGLILNNSTFYGTIKQWFNNSQITDQESIKPLVNEIYSDLLNNRLCNGKVYKFTYVKSNLIDDDIFDMKVTISNDF